jgi:hypothetical protein
MSRFVFRSLSFFLALGLGLFFGDFKLNVDDRPGLPKQRNEQVAKSQEHYNFFSPPQTATPDFEERGYPNNPPESRKTFCSDPKIRPIWNAIRRDSESREILEYTTESPDCKDMFEITYVDLDRDGKKEILVRSRNAQFCGAVGNCAFWILEKSRNGLRILLHGTDYSDVTKMGSQILRTRTNGYSDILLKGHFSASDTSYSTYKFNGKKYVETKCLYETPKVHNGDKTIWEFVTCKEFYRRLDL